MIHSMIDIDWSANIIENEITNKMRDFKQPSHLLISLELSHKFQRYRNSEI